MRHIPMGDDRAIELTLSSLAMSLAFTPGVVAVLAGSGMSRAAGVPTGWDVMADLVEKVAKTVGTNDDVEAARADPKAWWIGYTGQSLEWGQVLERLASTQGSRQALLESYFEPTPDAPVSSAAHRTLAKFVAEGRIRVIVTTNFDRLLERHLVEEGVEAQVIDSESAAKGMTPLVHSRATVVKLHGDYRSLATLNTNQEVSVYGDHMQHLLERVLDEFGLLVVGWSAQWDSALREAIRASANRRYQLYWAAHNGILTSNAQEIVAQRGQVIGIDGAGSFFEDLASRVARIERVHEQRSAPSIDRNLIIPPSDWLETRDAREPSLHVMIGATLAVEPRDRDLVITPALRDALVEALSHHRLTQGATNWANNWGYAMQSAPTSHDTLTWQEQPDGFQSLDVASYVLRNEATSADSAYVELHLRSTTMPSDRIQVLLGVSGRVHDSPLAVDEALEALDDLADAVAIAVPDAITMSTDSSVAATDLTLVVGSQMRPPQTKTPKIVEVVQLEMFGTSSNRVPDHLAASVRLNRPAESIDFRRLTIDAFEHMLLASGWTDPREGMGRLRDRLIDE